MITIATLMKLLATSIVASNLSGVSSSLRMSLLVFDPEFFSLLISEGIREKNATSDPDTIADESNRNPTTINATITSIEPDCKN